MMLSSIPPSGQTSGQLQVSGRLLKTHSSHAAASAEADSRQQTADSRQQQQQQQQQQHSCITRFPALHADKGTRPASKQPQHTAQGAARQL